MLQELLDMRGEPSVAPDLPLLLRPETLIDVYAIQHRVVAALLAQAGGRCIGYRSVHQRDRAGCSADRSPGVRPAAVADHLAKRYDARGRPVHHCVIEAEFAFASRRCRTRRQWPHAGHDRRAHRRADSGHRDRRLPVRVVGGRCVAHRRRQRDPRLVAPWRAGHGVARPRPRGVGGVGYPRRRACQDRLGRGGARSPAQRDGVAGR